MRCDSLVVGQAFQLGVSGIDLKFKQADRADNFALGEDQPVAVQLAASELRHPMCLARQTVMLEFPACSVAPGRGDLIDGWTPAVGGGAVRGIVKVEGNHVEG